MPKILVVDDSLSVRKVVQRTLEARGIEVVSAASASEAFERIEREEPDLVVCDVIMPDKDGYQICEFVKGHPRFGKIPVLLVSGIVNTMVLERAAKAQCNGFMRKPFSPDELLHKIDDLLAASVNGATALDTSPGGKAVGAGPTLEPQEPITVPPAIGLKTTLGQLAAIPGVGLAVLVDREGFLIESSGEIREETELSWALASHLVETSGRIGQALDEGTLHGVILEFERGMVLLHSVGSAALLGVVLQDVTALGKLRYSVKKALPELIRAV